VTGQVASEPESAAGQITPEQTAPPTIGELLGEKGIEQLARQLQQVPTLAGNTEVFPSVDQEEVYVDTFSGEQADKTAESGNLQATLPLPDDTMTASEFLAKVYQALGEKKEYGFSGLDRLLQGKEMQTILRSVAEEQWTVKPQELTEKDRMNAFYEKLDHQLSQMSDAVKAAGLGQTAFSASAAQVQGNIEFMNQVNQLYTYVQIPLQMAGGHTNGELYVYTNGKRHVDPDEELTAFLHLDMEHLGSTDVSVRMKGKQVRTNFYLSDDEAFRLVEEHLPTLQKRLEEKGYNCKLQVLGERETDLSSEERFGQMIGKQPTSRGILQRYSFDMKA
jgi:flagellar hook-length control protein FliK